MVAFLSLAFMQNRTLTDRQRQILEFIRRQQEKNGAPPTFSEIAGHFRFSSINAAVSHVQALVAKGALRHTAGRARAFQVVESAKAASPDLSGVITIPIYGTIPAGFPQDAAQGQEGCVLVDVNTLGIKATARTFGLKVQGDSMIGRHIVDGDIAVVEHGVQPRQGDVVAALIDGQVTLKTFLQQRGKPFLRAENPRYPNLIPQEELQIQGVMVALIRKRK
jgi:repressor LexA